MLQSGVSLHWPNAWPYGVGVRRPSIIRWPIGDVAVDDSKENDVHPWSATRAKTPVNNYANLGGDGQPQPY